MSVCQRAVGAAMDGRSELTTATLIEGLVVDWAARMSEWARPTSEPQCGLARHWQALILQILHYIQAFSIQKCE